MNEVVFSSVRQDWATPRGFFDALDAEFGFTLDACATTENTKVPIFFSVEDDALTKRWHDVVWCNPPYGYRIGKWVKKGFDEAQLGATVVMLIPAKTETAYWHDYVMRASEIRLIRGRLRFSGFSVNAPFPSAVVVFRQGVHIPTFSTIQRNGLPS